jgi:hypothetical protein
MRDMNRSTHEEGKHSLPAQLMRPEPLAFLLLHLTILEIAKGIPEKIKVRVDP